MQAEILYKRDIFLTKAQRSYAVVPFFPLVDGNISVDFEVHFFLLPFFCNKKKEFMKQNLYHG
jgi:hypothetical protein